MNGDTIRNYTATVHFFAEYTTAHVNVGMEWWYNIWDNGGKCYVRHTRKKCTHMSMDDFLTEWWHKGAVGSGYCWASMYTVGHRGVGGRTSTWATGYRCRRASRIRASYTANSFFLENSCTHSLRSSIHQALFTWLSCTLDKDKIWQNIIKGSSTA